MKLVKKGTTVVAPLGLAPSEETITAEETPETNVQNICAPSALSLAWDSRQMAMDLNSRTDQLLELEEKCAFMEGEMSNVVSERTDPISLKPLYPNAEKRAYALGVLQKSNADYLKLRSEIKLVKQVIKGIQTELAYKRDVFQIYLAVLHNK